MLHRLKRLVNPGILSLTPYQPGKPIEEVQRELGINEVIKLASNENPLGPSKKALMAAQNALTQMALYPDGSGYELKNALAQRLNITAKQIILGNGSDNVLAIIADAFVKPQEEIIISQYAFATFEIIAHTSRAKPVIIPAKGWGHDLDAMAKAITENTKLIFLANPNNPTGTWFSEQELLKFLTQVPEHVVIVIDEAYYEYMDDPHYPNTLGLLKKYPNLIVTRTFSKIYGLAGLRVGYGIAHESVIELLNRVRLPFNVNSIGLSAAQAALFDEEHVRDTLMLNKHGKLQLQQALEKMSLIPISNAGNFLTIDIGKDGLKVYQLLLAEGVIVRPLAAYGMPTHLRVSIGKPDENDRFINALEKVLLF